MAKFKDKEGRDWLIEITRGHLKPLRERFGLDLNDVVSKDKDNPLAVILSDIEKSGDLFWFLCEREAKKANISEADFPYLFNGQVIEDASAAVYEAVLEFFPHSRKAAKRAGTAFREAMGQIGDKGEELIGKAADKAKADLTSKLSAMNSGA